MGWQRPPLFDWITRIGHSFELEAKDIFQGHDKDQTTILEPLEAPTAKSPEGFLEKINGSFCPRLDTDQTETFFVDKELDKATALDTEAEEWEPTLEQARDWTPLKARVAGGGSHPKHQVEEL